MVFELSYLEVLADFDGQRLLKENCITMIGGMVPPFYTVIRKRYYQRTKPSSTKLLEISLMISETFPVEIIYRLILRDEH